MGSGLPISTILGFLVMRARMAASRFIAAPRLVGVLWCSLSIMPSNPSSSTYSHSSRDSLYCREATAGSKWELEKVTRTALLGLRKTSSSV